LARRARRLTKDIARAAGIAKLEVVALPKSVTSPIARALSSLSCGEARAGQRRRGGADRAAFRGPRRTRATARPTERDV